MDGWINGDKVACLPARQSQPWTATRPSKVPGSLEQADEFVGKAVQDHQYSANHRHQALVADLRSQAMSIYIYIYIMYTRKKSK